METNLERIGLSGYLKIKPDRFLKKLLGLVELQECPARNVVNQKGMVIIPIIQNRS